MTRPLGGDAVSEQFPVVIERPVNVGKVSGARVYEVAHARHTVAPVCYFPASPCHRVSACRDLPHVLDHLIRELGAADFFGALHESCEVVGDGLGGNGALETAD